MFANRPISVCAIVIAAALPSLAAPSCAAQDAPLPGPSTFLLGATRQQTDPSAVAPSPNVERELRALRQFFENTAAVPFSTKQVARGEATGAGRIPPETLAKMFGGATPRIIEQTPQEQKRLPRLRAGTRPGLMAREAITIDGNALGH